MKNLESSLKKSQTRPCPAQSKSLFIIGAVNSAINTSTSGFVEVIATVVVVLGLVVVALVVVVINFVVDTMDACVVVTCGGMGKSILHGMNCQLMNSKYRVIQ